MSDGNLRREVETQRSYRLALKENIANAERKISKLEDEIADNSEKLGNVEALIKRLGFALEGNPMDDALAEQRQQEPGPDRARPANVDEDGVIREDEPILRRL